MNYQELAARGSTSPTAGYCEGYVQANLVALPEQYAQDFEAFCRKNPKPCPLLEVDLVRELPRHIAGKERGSPSLPRLWVWDGRVQQEKRGCLEFYQGRPGLFPVGMQLSFESALVQAGIGLRHVEEQGNVSMYNTNIPLVSRRIISLQVIWW